MMGQVIVMTSRQCGKAVALRRAVSIQSLLEWAFRRECAQLDFGDSVARMSGYGYASATAAIIQHEQLGCRIEGGGRSEPHPDADVVAHAVSVLPESRGGRRMAIWIAELARAGTTPDWMPGAEPRCYPVDTHTNRHGTLARTEDAAKLGSAGWPAQVRRNRKGVLVQDAVQFCPVVVRPSASDIARARRAYLDWWGALLDLRATFQLYGGLSAYRVTDAMPPRAPWQKGED